MFGYEKKPFELVESAGPTVFVAAARFVVVEAGMSHGELGSVRDSAQFELDKRLAGILDAARPAPGHAQPLGLYDFAIFPAALVLALIEHSKAHPEAAANPRVDLRRKHGTGIR